MSIIDTLITDRTQADADRAESLAAKGWQSMAAEEQAEYSQPMKGAYNAADLNRVNGAMSYLAGRFRGYGYTIELAPVPVWERRDIPSPAQMEVYLSNLAALRAVFTVLSTTPAVPPDMEDPTPEECNDIERILIDIEFVIDHSAMCFKRLAAYGFVSGNVLFPSFTSDLGRTWNDLDALAMKWSDLDAHGSSWYVIQYGVLK